MIRERRTERGDWYAGRGPLSQALAIGSGGSCEARREAAKPQQDEQAGLTHRLEKTLHKRTVSAQRYMKDCPTMSVLGVDLAQFYLAYRYPCAWAGSFGLAD